MRGDLRNPKTEAQVQMRRAESFWEMLDLTVHRIRYFASLEAHYNCMFHKEMMSHRPRALVLDMYEDRRDAAHDMRICDEQNLQTLAEQARGAEMMARIWHEEQYEGPPDDFALHQPITDWER